MHIYNFLSYYMWNIHSYIYVLEYHLLFSLLLQSSSWKLKEFKIFVNGRLFLRNK